MTYFSSCTFQKHNFTKYFSKYQVNFFGSQCHHPSSFSSINTEHFKSSASRHHFYHYSKRINSSKMVKLNNFLNHSNSNFIFFRNHLLPTFCWRWSPRWSSSRSFHSSARQFPFLMRWMSGAAAAAAAPAIPGTLIPMTTRSGAGVPMATSMVNRKKTLIKKE